MKLLKTTRQLNATVTNAEQREMAVIELDEQWSDVERRISNGYSFFFIPEQGKFWRRMLASEQKKLQTLYCKNCQRI